MSSTNLPNESSDSKPASHLMIDPPTLLDLRRVHGLVRSFVPPHVDSEDLAVEILIESWSKGHTQPSWSFIRHRCLDNLQAASRELEVMKDKSTHEPEFSPDDELDQKLLVNALVSVLSPLEKKVVWYRFYMDLSTNDIASRAKLPLTSVRELLAQALFKMKQASWS